MKLFVINSCFLVLLMAALGKASVFDSGLEDDERIQRAFECTIADSACTNPCDSSSLGNCDGAFCCPYGCLTFGAQKTICNKDLPSCVAAACGNKCCTPCTIGSSECQDQCRRTTCSATESCQCLAAIPGTNPNNCACACDSAKCPAPDGSRKCGTSTVPCGKGVTTCTCSAGTCGGCGPCNPTKCDEDCKADKAGDTGSCASGTCVCTTPTPPVTNPCTSKCDTTITFNIDTCGGKDVPCP